jgi:Zn-dependent protease
MAAPIPPEASQEIEFVKGLVAKRFPVYDVRVNYDVVEFFCRIEPTTLEETFEELRQDMAPHGYIPMVSYDGGEHIIRVARRPKMKYRSTTVNLVFFVITFLTMLLAGVLDWASYADSSGALFSADNIVMGTLTFTLPLMAILGVHELGHFFMARRRKVAASLPFFIPSFPPLGTFGAFISLRDPIPNKKALIEIGAAGPICGLLLAIPLAILGLVLTNDGAKLAPHNVTGDVVGVSFPLLYSWLEQLFPITGDYLLHPTAFAAWVGILVTALNLLPVGQLDGGHIARALLGNKTRYLSWAVAAILIGLSLLYTGWFLFAMLVILIGVRHPPPLNDISPLDLKRKLIGVLAFVVLIIAFVPQPMVAITQDYKFELTPVDESGLNGTILPGGTFATQIIVDNTGNTGNQIHLQGDSSVPSQWTIEFKNVSQNDSSYVTLGTVDLNAGDSVELDVLVTASPGATPGISENITILATSANDTDVKRTLTMNLSVVTPSLAYWVLGGQLSVARGSQGDVTVMLNNTDDTDANITLATNQTRPSFVDYQLHTISPTGAPVSELNITVPANGSVSFGVNITVGLSASFGTAQVNVDIYIGEGVKVGEITVILLVT